MRVLLIHPGVAGSALFGKAQVQSAAGLPVGLLSVAAVLDRLGASVTIVDCLVEDGATTQRQGGRFLRGLPTRRLEQELERLRPRVVGISNRFFTQQRDTLRIARLAKRIDPDVVVAVGGGHAAMCAAELLRDYAVDLVALGEGEPMAPQLLELARGERPLSQVEAVAYRDESGRIRRTPAKVVDRLDDLPLPAYHLVDMERYLTLHRRGIHSRDRDVQRDVAVVTTRGCPHRCTFCAVQRTMGTRWRAQPASRVTRHLEVLARTYGARHIHFEDDNLLHDLDRFDPILEALRELGLSWDTPNGICVDPRLSETRLELMRRSGCRSLHVGVESGDPRVLRRSIGKALQLDQVVELAGRCRAVGLPLRAFFMLGLPGDTLASMQRTIELALALLRDHHVEPIVLLATPLPGTRLHDECSEQGLLARVVNAETLTDSIEPEGHALVRTADFTPEDVERLSRELSRRAYRIMIARGLRHPWRTLRRVGTLPWALRATRRLLGI